jgi:GNAT superfamily N-acetyltransferase
MTVTCPARSHPPSVTSYPSYLPYQPTERRDGWAIEVRPFEPGDTAAMLEVFAGLGPRSRELRFLTPKPHLTSADVRQLSAVDQHDHVAVLAVSTRHRRPIGIARFVRDPLDPLSADVAVEVIDTWQGRGVGTRLATALAQCARELGVRRFTLVMSRENDAALGLLHKVQGEVTRLAIDLETAEFEVRLGGPTHRQPRIRKGR